MHNLTKGVALVALVISVLAVGGVMLLGGEVWLAARGTTLPDPPAGPNDVLAGPTPDGVPVSAPSVVWLGDSTAAGVGASGPATTLPAQVAHQLDQPIRLTVLAQSGARVADVLRSQVPALARLHPSEVYISVGANDATHLTPRARFRRDYGRLLASLPASVVRVVVLGVPDLGGPPRLPQPLRAIAAWRGRLLAADIRALARRGHATFVDIAAGAGPAFRRQPDRFFAADRYHPSDAGYGLWATVVRSAVQGRRPDVHRS